MVYPADVPKTLPQRRRAERLRSKSAKGKVLTATEKKWLAWYEATVGPANLGEVVAEAGGVEDEVQPDPTPEDDAQPTEPPAPRYDAAGQPIHVATPGTVERLTVGDCSEESMRSAVNTQIAAGQMMERAAQLAIDHAAQMSGQVGDLVAQLINAMTSLVEVQYARGREHVEAMAERAQDTPEAQTSAVTEELARKMIDGVFPAAKKVETKT